MNYQRIYNNLITRAKARTLTGYKEIHHIIPRCLGGSDDSSNLVELTPEEHYTCHQLLVKMYPDNDKLLNAALFMTANGMGQRSNKIYGWLRRKYSEYMKGPNNPSKLYGPWNKGITGYKNNTVFSEDTIKQISARMKDKNPCAGIKPWNHPRATDYSKSVWQNADVLYKIWMENNKPSYCKLYTLANKKCYTNESKVIGPYMNLVKYFKEGWLPEQDNEWKEFTK